jgi:hypothetical protein
MTAYMRGFLSRRFCQADIQSRIQPAGPKISPIPCPVMVHVRSIVASRIAAAGYKLMRSFARTVEAIARPAQSSQP